MNPQDLDKLIKQNQALRDADRDAELDEFKRVCLIKNLVYIHSRLSRGSDREASIPLHKLKWHRNWFMRVWRAFQFSWMKRGDYTHYKMDILIQALRVRGFEVSSGYQALSVRLPHMPEIIDQSADRRQFAKVAFGLTDEQIDEILKGTADT